jgi:glycopeptide antibiotics resistance protein
MYQLKGGAQASQAAAHYDYIIGMIKTIGFPQLVTSLVLWLLDIPHTTYHVSSYAGIGKKANFFGKT